MSRFKTQHYKSILPNSTQIYNFLIENIKWEKGIYSRKKGKITRDAYHFGSNILVDTELLYICQQALILCNLENSYNICGIYLNYYKNGNDWCPSHNHPKTIQMVISLGATRSFKIGKKIFEVKNSDIMVFGSSQHELLEDSSIVEGRISIACFLIPL